MTGERQTPHRAQGDDDGFMLIAVIVMIFLVLLVLSIAAPRVAMQLKRERDLEAKHRGEQYVVAIRKFYGTFGRYPSSIKELEGTNNQRFLRQEYIDPLTGKSDWRLIHLGENKTKVKGLFGQDLPGVPGSGVGPGLQGGPATSPPGFGGSALGPAQAGAGAAVGGSNQTGFGSGTQSAFNNNPGSTPGQTQGPGLGSGGLGSDGPGTSTVPGGPASSNAPGDSSLGGLPSTGGLIIGVGVPQSGDSVASVNGEHTYDKWEFLYDPRIEQLRAGWSVFGGGGLGSTPATGLGNGAGNGLNGAPGAGPGNRPGNGALGGAFGSGGSAFGGGSSAFGNGQPPGSATGAPGTTSTGQPAPRDPAQSQQPPPAQPPTQPPGDPGSAPPQ